MHLLFSFAKGTFTHSRMAPRIIPDHRSRIIRVVSSITGQASGVVLGAPTYREKNLFSVPEYTDKKWSVSHYSLLEGTVFLPCNHRVHPGVSHPEDAGCSRWLHGCLPGVVFHRCTPGWKTAQVWFFLFFITDMPVRQGSRWMPARCLHRNAGDNTDETQSDDDPWLSAVLTEWKPL